MAYKIEGTKYVYNIRSSNGILVQNLQIYGKTEAEATQKLYKMYRNCEIIDTQAIASSAAIKSMNYEDVLSLLSEN